MSTHHPVASAPEPVRSGIRPLTPAQVCGITVFPILGTGLTLGGMPVLDVLLLAGCGAIGAGTIAAAGGGRRLLTSLASAAVRAAAGADTGLK
ncbi:hypothetical protein ACFWHV_21750 [Streptomyces collinus]|uniref:hypothetical protein n=1 Tax=Streptomyces collinus TaxID=42684 RepID=UPI00365567C2